MTTSVRTLAVPSWAFARLLRHVHAHLQKLKSAHAARLQHMAASDLDLSDVGMSREEVMGSSSHQPDLPFFMQHGFQAHRV